MGSKSKVIGLGLGRTGTTSLMAALDYLGFGPCYHMTTILHKWDPEEIDLWYKFGQCSATTEDLQEHLKEYNTILDYPGAIYYDKLYETYPEAKFILTIRDPVKWEESINATIIPAIQKFKDGVDSDPFMAAMSKWFGAEMQDKYHQNKLCTSDARGEILRHTERVIKTIPANQLLVYEISEGWEPLVKFLGVEKPDIPFPHINDTVQFRAKSLPFIERGGKSVT